MILKSLIIFHVLGAKRCHFFSWRAIYFLLNVSRIALVTISRIEDFFWHVHVSFIARSSSRTFVYFLLTKKLSFYHYVSLISSLTFLCFARYNLFNFSFPPSCFCWHHLALILVKKYNNGSKIPVCLQFPFLIVCVFVIVFVWSDADITGKYNFDMFYILTCY